MLDERVFVRRLESADVRTLIQLLRRPSQREEELLRRYLGDEAYRRMHSLALQEVSQRTAAPKGNVVVLHGVMGSELTRFPAGKAGVHFWVNLPRMVWGEFVRCRMNDDGRSEQHDIRATGILLRYYGELLLYLASQQWNVRPFWFDWRKDIRLSASSLESQLRAWFREEERAPVHFVAHSMGGVVVRAFMKMYPDRWRRLADRGSRLIMLGTPNFGSFAITQVLTGTESMVRLIARLDVWNSLREVRAIACTFPGCYQMLPSPDAMPAAEVLYDADTWRHLPEVSQRHLKDARQFQQWLNSEIDPRSVYIAGYNKPTAYDIRHNEQDEPDFVAFREADYDKASNAELYQFTRDGDGTVPHRLGFLQNEKAVFDDIYYVEDEHGRLPANRQVMEAVTEILQTGTTKRIATEKPAVRGAADERQLAQQWTQLYGPEKDIEVLARRLTTRARSLAIPNEPPSLRLRIDTQREAEVSKPDTATVDQLAISNDERELENLALRSFVSAHGKTPDRGNRLPLIGEPPSIEIGSIQGAVEDERVYEALEGEGAPVDCIAVGHYIGVRPQQAELALDRAISRSLLSRVPEQGGGNGEAAESDASDTGEPQQNSPRDLILTQFTERGTLLGQLGQPFLLPDPRDDSGRRSIAVAGMGLPGRFGIPELTVLARELCWSLGQLGKRHLLTVLIGGGSGNLSTTDAVQAWLRGIEQALGGAYEADAKRLQKVTFVELDAERIGPLNSAIKGVGKQIAHSLIVNFRSHKAVKPRRDRAEQRRRAEQKSQQNGGPNAPPTRITVQMVGDAYHFGAITEQASIPERVIKIDPRIVLRANDKLAAAYDNRTQHEQGRFLEKLLIPRDLREQLKGSAPVVLVLDRTTARLHWELVAQPDPLGSFAADLVSTMFRDDVSFDQNAFLGTARGLTRQFRTVLAPPPEPPPPPRRVLRVLVVADPAADAPLAGAEQEGIEVADLFESFNERFADRTQNRVEVERLFGPYEATRENVLQKLMLEPWDVLHFAGHCYYNAEQPSASGWIFAKKDLEVLSASELNRIDRVPKFVFSNACESGVTPDQAEKRDPRLAPSFAEAFFERGVANFVCTAWPVDDSAARAFAKRLYEGLLGLQDPDNPAPECMYRAMREARCAIADLGGRTWGAYQHYGNPNFSLFDAESFIK